MHYRVDAPRSLTTGTIALPASKSISNRALILDALTGFKSKLTNLSKANDTALLQAMLSPKRQAEKLNAGDAGTVLRFALVYYSLIDGQHIITGTDRLMQRPMKPLVDALKRLGGNIRKKKISDQHAMVVEGGKLKGGEVEVDGSQSSQFVSALLLCGAAMPRGLTLTLKGKIVSAPYIDMTLALLDHVGIAYQQSKSKIVIPRQAVLPFRLRVESDWSGASYLFSSTALAKPGTELLLKGLSLDSTQGDSAIAELMKAFGVKSTQRGSDVVIRKTKTSVSKRITIDATDFPDLVPALAATALGLGVPVTFKGIAHLRHKESDRIEALVETAKKFNAKAKATKTGFSIIPPTRLPDGVFVNTYDDHRMALAFAPLALRCNELAIENTDVVKKSFPTYWSELKKLGFRLMEN